MIGKYVYSCEAGDWRGEMGVGKRRKGWRKANLPSCRVFLSGGSHCHSPWAQVPVAEGALALSKLPWRVVELWEFLCLIRIQNTLSRTWECLKHNFQISISLELLLQSRVRPPETWAVRRGYGSVLSLNTEDTTPEPHSELQGAPGVFAKGTACPHLNVCLSLGPNYTPG